MEAGFCGVYLNANDALESLEKKGSASVSQICLFTLVLATNLI